MEFRTLALTLAVALAVLAVASPASADPTATVDAAKTCALDGCNVGPLKVPGVQPLVKEVHDRLTCTCPPIQ